MAYSDPQSITIGSAISLPRTGQGLLQGEFTASDTNTKLNILHRNLSKGRIVHEVRLDRQQLSADPLSPDVNRLNTMSVRIVINVPGPGYITTADQKAAVDGLVAWASASTGANITKLLGGES